MSDDFAAKYPENVRLNGTVIRDRIVCNNKTISGEILDWASLNRTYVLSIKQGYTKCSIALVSDDALITDDDNIYNACKDRFDALKVDKGSIRLPGTDYGFIGGAAFKLSKSILMFTGSAKLHSCYESIKAFCRNHSVYVESLCGGELIDIGGVIPIEEKRQV